MRMSILPTKPNIDVNTISRNELANDAKGPTQPTSCVATATEVHTLSIWNAGEVLFRPRYPQHWNFNIVS